jgi:uncharacterized protein with NAD-binding domain and iron-sulfur cluster
MISSNKKEFLKMKKEEQRLQRFNGRLGYTQNKWLDEESARTGISKSALIQMAVEQYIAQKQALNAMYDMKSIVDKLESMELMLKNQNKER